MRIYFERQLTYFLFNVFLLEYFFTSVAFLIYVIDVTAFADILNIILVLLLTNVAYRFVLADTVPKVSYLTAFDVYSFLSICTIIGVLLIAFAAALQSQD